MRRDRIFTIIVFAIREHLTMYTACTFYMHANILEINNLIVHVSIHIV